RSSDGDRLSHVSSFARFERGGGWPGRLRLGRDPPPGGGGRAPLATALPLPVFPGGAAPDAVDLVLAERELQALAPHSAPGAVLLGACDLRSGRADRGDREEEIRVRGQAGPCRPPVPGAPSRTHSVSSQGV